MWYIRIKLLYDLQGGRFDLRPIYTRHFYNNCWVRMEAPAVAGAMERSAYWRHKKHKKSL